MSSDMVYTSNINIPGNVTLSYNDIKKIKDLLEKCSESLKKIPANTPQQNVNTPQQQDFIINIFDNHMQRSQTFYDFDGMFEAAKQDPSLAKVNNISIVQPISGINVSIYRNGFSVFKGISFSEVPDCAISILSVLANSRREVWKQWRKIISLAVFIVLSVIPIVSTACLLNESSWYLLLLIIPLGYSAARVYITNYIYSKLIDKGSQISLVQNADDISKENRRKRLNSFYIIASTLIGIAGVIFALLQIIR